MFDWTGLYVGVQAGVVRGTGTYDDNYCHENDCGNGGPPFIDRYIADLVANGGKAGVHMG